MFPKASGSLTLLWSCVCIVGTGKDCTFYWTAKTSIDGMNAGPTAWCSPGDLECVNKQRDHQGSPQPINLSSVMQVYISVIQQHQIILVLCFGCVSRKEVSECAQCAYELVRGRCHQSVCHVLSMIPRASICPSFYYRLPPAVTLCIVLTDKHYINMQYYCQDKMSRTCVVKYLGEQHDLSPISYQ